MPTPGWEITSKTSQARWIRSQEPMSMETKHRRQSPGEPADLPPRPLIIRSIYRCYLWHDALKARLFQVHSAYSLNDGPSDYTVHRSSISFVCQVLLHLPTKSSGVLLFPSFPLQWSLSPLIQITVSYNQTFHFWSALTSPSTSNPNHFISLIRDLDHVWAFWQRTIRDLEHTICNPLLVLMLMLMLKLMSCCVPGFVASPRDTKKNRAELFLSKELTMLWRKSTSSPAIYLYSHHVPATVY